ncbi:hypothetical protein FP507_06060 [Chlorobium phaeovibrioides]|uniref:Alginate export domain-containing protein n=4 Tax=Chlorobium phaeovibrioides TaxID=1094 RepID=A0A5M8ICM2_CHLPH|nr:hypothetical protein FP507_06060 [Chlorobium phaeovibrioides]
MKYYGLKWFHSVFHGHITQTNQTLIMKKTAMLIGLAAVLGFSSNAQAIDWNWKGDIRYRYQSQLKADQDDVDDHSKDRHRIRVRFGVSPWINEELSAGLQLSSGGDDPVSRNETLGDNFAADGIMLNQAYIDYHPMFLDGDVNFILGKREAKSTLTVIDDLVWDGDVTLEGITVQYGKDAKGKEKSGLCAIAGYYLVDEAAYVGEYEGTAPYLLAAQLSYKGTVSDLGYQVGASYYNYVNLGHGKIADYSEEMDYDIVELFGNVSGKVSSLPWKLYGQFAQNFADTDEHTYLDDDANTAYLVGLKLGKAKKPGQMEASVEYFNLGESSVNPYLTDSDRGDLTAQEVVGDFLTNVEGFKVGAKYQLIQNMQLGMTYFNTGYADAPEGTDSDWRGHMLQADAVVKF